MSGTTSDRSDPRLTRGVDDKPVAQAEVYLVLSEEDRAKGFVRPFRDEYFHVECPRFPVEKFGEATVHRLAKTRMGLAIAETYARDPYFYGGTYCVHCRMHRPLTEFRWLDGSRVGE